MKAKIAPKPEIVLLYQQEKIKNGDKLPEILEQMGIRWKAVTQQELCFTTGELAEYRRKEDGERQELQQIPQTPAMAMGGIAGKRLDQLLNALNREQIDLPVKMVITPHNESWVFGELIEEVRKEHELFLAMERLKRLSMRAQTLENEEGPLSRALFVSTCAASGAAADGKQGHYFTAMASISTRAPSGSAATATQLRAG